ncbi:MAG: sugar phosphate isomerase/epimerase family protein [Bryobacteraceae bacterium]
MLSRRAFLGAAAPVLAASGRPRVPIALELFSLRYQCEEDLEGALRAVARMGYQGVEFYRSYLDFTPERARAVRKLLDGLQLFCAGTHTPPAFLAPDRLPRAIELNHILGSTRIVQASSPRITAAKGWFEVAERLTAASARMRSEGLRAGFHNHAVEFQAVEGKIPWEIVAANTPAEVFLQLDIGSALSAGVDPVSCIRRYPGRSATMHVKDYSPRGKVLLGEGEAPLTKIFEAAERTGAVECYIIEQEGSERPMEAVERCLRNMRNAIR